jgi:hypothetical protein
MDAIPGWRARGLQARAPDQPAVRVVRPVDDNFVTGTTDSDGSVIPDGSIWNSFGELAGGGAA